MKKGWRAALVVLGLVLAAVSVWQLASYRREQGRLDRLARGSGVLAYEPGLPEGLAREPSPWHARLLLARQLFASASSASPVEPEEADRSAAATLRRLELARRLAASVAVERPSSWEAAMLQGAAAYLGWSMQRDRRLLTEPGEWEAPLLRALEVAPGRPEPARFLAAAYMELWPALSRGKKETARGLVARALADRRTFEALIEPWLQTADSSGERTQAFSAVPLQPWAWERLQQIEARDADWEGYRQARLHWYASLERSMRASLAEAEARLQGGDAVRAHLLFLSVLQVPPRRRFLPYVESSLSQCPPGPGGGSFAPALQAWLDWSLDLCLWKGCPVPEPVLRRLAGLSGGLAPTTAAQAAVLGGDLAEGEVFERRAEEPWSAVWGPYGIARARALAKRRDLAEAGQALDNLHPLWKQSAPYWMTRLALARAAGDGLGEAEARRRLTDLRRSEWSFREWMLRDPAPRLELVPAVAAPGFTIEILEAPDAGAAVEVRLDGEVAAISPVRRSTALVVRRPLKPGPAYLLEIEAVSGGRLVPGTVRLLPPSP
ncbi:MAG: hypothetical protein ABUT39_08345 [Acidobacteriota bacterium]